MWIALELKILLQTLSDNRSPKCSSCCCKCRPRMNWTQEASWEISTQTVLGQHLSRELCLRHLSLLVPFVEYADLVLPYCNPWRENPPSVQRIQVKGVTMAIPSPPQQQLVSSFLVGNSSEFFSGRNETEHSVEAQRPRVIDDYTSDLFVYRWFLWVSLVWYTTGSCCLTSRTMCELQSHGDTVTIEATVSAENI